MSYAINNIKIMENVNSMHFYAICEEIFLIIVHYAIHCAVFNATNHLNLEVREVLIFAEKEISILILQYMKYYSLHSLILAISTIVRNLAVTVHRITHKRYEKEILSPSESFTPHTRHGGHEQSIFLTYS